MTVQGGLTPALTRSRWEAHAALALWLSPRRGLDDLPPDHEPFRDLRGSP